MGKIEYFQCRECYRPSGTAAKRETVFLPFSSPKGEHASRKGRTETNINNLEQGKLERFWRMSPRHPVEKPKFPKSLLVYFLFLGEFGTRTFLGRVGALYNIVSGDFTFFLPFLFTAIFQHPFLCRSRSFPLFLLISFACFALRD